MRRRPFIATVGLLLGGCMAPGQSDTGKNVGTTTADGTPVAPLVNWRISLDRHAESATVTHDTGEPITAEETAKLEFVLTTAPDHPIPTDATLTPTPTPQIIRTTWREAGGRYPITEGDSVTTDGASPGDTLAVWWFGNEHHRNGIRLESETFAKV